MNTRRLIRVLRWPLAAVAVVALLGVGPLWAVAIYDRYVPRRVTLDLLIGCLEAIRLAFLLAVVIVPAGLAAVIVLIVRARRRGGRTPIPAMRILVILGSSLLGLGLLEAFSAVWLAWSHRLPALPTRFANGGPGDGQIDMVVVGESSALGVPYNPRLSMGQILAWQLEQVLPGQRVHVEMRAAVGLTLEGAVQKITDLTRRPDAILVYSGHNEFHGRYGWDREVSHYDDEIADPSWRAFLAVANRVSHLASLVQEHADRLRAERSPPAQLTRELVGRPIVTPAEYDALVAGFRRQLEALVRYCDHIGAVPILVIPPGNEGDHPPAVSYASPDTDRAEREAFAQAFHAACALESDDPETALHDFRDLCGQQPGFAEAHYRLARALVSAGQPAPAREQFVQARDLDGLPMRCTSRFQQVYRELAARYPSVVLVDGPDVVRRLAPTGIPGDAQFHDAQHPNFRSYVALAQEALDRLQTRHAFGWPEGQAAPVIDPTECATHFGMDSDAWAIACEHSAAVYRATANLRHDPTPNLRKADLLEQAARRIRQGEAPEDVGVPGLGVWMDLPL